MQERELMRIARRNKWTITYVAGAVTVGVILQIIETVRR